MYELIFWKYADEIYMNHHLVYEAILEGKTVDGLAEIPVITICNRIQNLFSDWEKVDDESWKNAKTNAAFQIKTTAQSMIINCFGTNGKDMDKLVSILEEFQCPLYDPQIPMRYDEFND